MKNIILKGDINMFKGLLKIAMSGIITGAAYTAGAVLFDRVIWVKGKEAIKHMKVTTYKIIRVKKGEKP